MTSCERHCTTYVDSQLLCINALGEDMTHCFQIFSAQVAHVNHYATTHFVKIPLLQRTIYSGFQLKTIVNGFTTVVKSKPLAKNRCKIFYNGF
jgi:hypothetical protein